MQANARRALSPAGFGPGLLVSTREREFFIDNLLVRIHYIIVMFRWTGLAPWELEFPFSGSRTSTFLEGDHTCLLAPLGLCAKIALVREFIDYKTSMITD